MTLVLTELSEAGIAMAADSAITILINNRISEAERQNWNKLLRVPRIPAAISYWGTIGLVTQVQFDLWLQRIIDTANYTDLHSFADRLVESLNAACHNQPLPERQDVGIHVAGYAEWPDGQRRPIFIHIHNGHGHMRYDLEHEPIHRERIVAVHPTWVSEPRKLFEKHQDFPFIDKSVEENLDALRLGYITRNGDYSLYALISMHLDRALALINLIPGTSIPRDPTSLRSRKGLLHVVLDTMVNLYRCSSRSPTIGGVVSSLGISSNGYVE